MNTNGAEHAPWRGPVAFGVRTAIALLLSALFIWRKSLTSAMLVHFLLDASALLAGMEA